MSTTLLKAGKITKTYNLGPGIDLQVLKGASLAASEGEFVAIMGSSGSGKSTLLHLLGALDRPTSGQVFFRGQNIFSQPQKTIDHIRCNSFGFVFQFYHLLPELNVFENTLFPQMIQHSITEWLTNGAEAKLRCRQTLEKVGLQKRLHHRPNQLSGGERQRVAIARALANAPAVLLADEPTGNLDKHTGNEVMRLLQELHGSGQTIVMVTHDEEVAQVADRIIQLDDGQILGKH